MESHACGKLAILMPAANPFTAAVSSGRGCYRVVGVEKACSYNNLYICFTYQTDIAVVMAVNLSIQLFELRIRTFKMIELKSRRRYSSLLVDGSKGSLLSISVISRGHLSRPYLQSHPPQVTFLCATPP